MEPLESIIKKNKEKMMRNRDPRRYVSHWTERELLNGKIVDAFVMVLRTRGCAWALKSGCSMCGYINDAVRDDVSQEDLLFQFKEVLEHYSHEKVVKIFTSGSFLDEGEVPIAVRSQILNELGKTADKIIIESRPEFITDEGLESLDKSENIEIALGLESANDFVGKYSINKGFIFQDYANACEIAKRNSIPVKTYLLIKPPFLSEKCAIEDAIESAKKASKYSSEISFNSVNVQRFTLVEKLWKNGEYRPPWLWSVVEVLRHTSKLLNVRVVSSPTGGGKRRGAHNCGNCDDEFLNKIDDFSLMQEQDPEIWDELECDCKELWLDILDVEDFSKTQGNLIASRKA